MRFFGGKFCKQIPTYMEANIVCNISVVWSLWNDAQQRHANPFMSSLFLVPCLYSSVLNNKPGANLGKKSVSYISREKCLIRRIL